MSELTVKQLAEREQVSERTVRRWIAKEAVDIIRTPGGGVRIKEYRQSGAVFLTDSDDKVGHPST